MPNEAIRPTTLTGIKTLAKELKVRNGIRHSAALDKAAQVAGYQNFAHAHRQLSAGAMTPGSHTIYITTYWRSRMPADAGQETVSIQLPVPLDQLIRPHQMRHARYLRGFHFTASDHVVDELTTRSQSDARRRACAAIRTLTFMQATGLKPSSGHSRAYPRGSARNAMPGHDHSSEWFDPKVKVYVLVDEPYRRGNDGRISEERLAWAAHFGWNIVKSSWGGVYNPEGKCELYLAADKAGGYDLAPIVEALDALPPPFVEEHWTGVSSLMRPRFQSPGDKIKAAAPKPPPKPRGKTGPRVTVGYHAMFDSRARRRPDARMPMEAHTEVGYLIKKVLAECWARAGVVKRLERVRTDLDDWVQREYGPGELPDAKFFDLYYRGDEHRGPRVPPGVAWKKTQLEHLQRVQSILKQHYPDCPPRRTLIASSDYAIKSLKAWAA